MQYERRDLAPPLIETDTFLLLKCGSLLTYFSDYVSRTRQILTNTYIENINPIPIIFKLKTRNKIFVACLGWRGGNFFLSIAILVFANNKMMY